METDKKISLIDKVKNANAESYEKWFDRWYKSLDIEKKILRSAQEGYTGTSIIIKRHHESENDFDKKRAYEVRRLRDKRTIEKLQNKLGEGFTIDYKIDRKKIKYFGLTSNSDEDWISIKWAVSNI